MNELLLPLPPPPTSSSDVVGDYVAEIADALVPSIRRLDTPGVALSFQWPVYMDGERCSIEVRCFYCLGCAALHRHYAVFSDAGECLEEVDLDTHERRRGEP